MHLRRVRMGLAAAVLGLPACTQNNPAFGLEPKDSSSGASGGPGGSTTTAATPTTTAATTTAVDVTSEPGTAATTATTSGPATTGPATATEPDTTTEPATGTDGTSTSTASTTGDPGSTGMSDGETTVEPSGCGNHKVEADLGEQCDDGLLNADNADCTSLCQKNFCGDGLVNENGMEPEVCDQVLENGAGLGFCSYDCKAVVPKDALTIRWLGQLATKGNLFQLGNVNTTGLAAGDEVCAKNFGPGYKILAVDGVTRRATVTAWAGDLQLDWVLKPYQGYQNGNAQLIGITGKEALLGINNAVKQDIKFALGMNSSVWTGMTGGWVSAQDCQDWSTTSGGQVGAIGNGGDPGTLFWGNGISNCANHISIYCVQQLP